MAAQILVAGIGNIFLGDDGFGPEVVQHVRVTDDGVRVVDYGIRGMHLAYDLLDGCDNLVLVDALPDRGSPGALVVFEVEHESHRQTTGIDAHGMDPAAVFASLHSLGGAPPPTIVVGCQVQTVAEGIGLSDPVRAAVPDAVDIVEQTVARLLAKHAALSGRAD